MTWDMLPVILLVAGLVGLFSALIHLGISAYFANKPRWNGTIKVRVIPSGEAFWENSNIVHGAFSCTPGARVRGIELCDVRAGYVPFVKIMRRKQGVIDSPDVPFLMSYEVTGVELRFPEPLQEENAGEYLTIRVYNEIDGKGELEPPREFSVKWKRVAVLA